MSRIRNHQRGREALPSSTFLEVPRPCTHQDGATSLPSNQRALARPNMIRKNELSFVGGPAEWVIAKQREDARRVATAQRRNGYTSGSAPPCPCLPRA